MDNAFPLINNCTIRNNNGAGIDAYNLYGGKLSITNSTISNTKGRGISITAHGSTVVTISDNIISASSGSGIQIDGYSGTVVIISDNIISNNSASFDGGGGIYISDGIVTISNNIINNNSASSTSEFLSSHGGGIYIKSYNKCTISNNIISNNSASFGGGIYSGTNTSITSNSLTGNFAKNAPAVYVYDTTGSTLTNNQDFKYNTINSNRATDSANAYTVYIKGLPLFNSNNLFSNTATYELWNDNYAGGTQLNAENNWWGTGVDSEIQGKIWDWFDDSSKVIADYSPFATAIITDAPISPPTGLIATAETGSVTLNWSANPESDVAGYKVYWDTDSGYPYANSVDVGNVTSYTINNLPQGTYYLTVTAYDTIASSVADDPNTIINEKQTNGNESWYAEEVTVPGNQADLKAGAVICPKFIKKGKKINIKIIGKNMGDENATSFTVEFYLSSNSNKSVDSDTSIGEKSILRLNKSKKRVVFYSWRIPKDLTIGTYYIKAVWDSENSISESDEENNIGVSGKIRIK